jgi:hypothetical protein
METKPYCIHYWADIHGTKCQGNKVTAEKKEVQNASSLACVSQIAADPDTANSADQKEENRPGCSHIHRRYSRNKSEVTELGVACHLCSWLWNDVIQVDEHESPTICVISNTGSVGCLCPWYGRDGRVPAMARQERMTWTETHKQQETEEGPCRIKA